MRCITGQDKTHVAGRFFQGLEQRIGCDVIHAFRWVNQDGLATPTPTRTLRKLHRITHGLDPDFPARLALLVIDLGLGLLGERPAQFQHQRLRHQHTQVGMGSNLDRMATLALSAGALRATVFTQPGAHQLEAKPVLPHARRAVQQKGVAALLEQA